MASTNLETLVSAEINRHGNARVTYKMRYTTQDAAAAVKMEDSFQVRADLQSIDVQPFTSSARAGHTGRGCRGADFTQNGKHRVRLHMENWVERGEAAVLHRIARTQQLDVLTMTDNGWA